MQLDVLIQQILMKQLLGPRHKGCRSTQCGICWWGADCWWQSTGRDRSKQINKWNVTGLITKLVKRSGNTVRDCTTQEASQWPLHLKRNRSVALSDLSLPLPSGPLCHITGIISFIVESSCHLVYLLVNYMVIKALGVGTPCVSLGHHCMFSI